MRTTLLFRSTLLLAVTGLLAQAFTIADTAEPAFPLRLAGRAVLTGVSEAGLVRTGIELAGVDGAVALPQRSGPAHSLWRPLV